MVIEVWNKRNKKGKITCLGPDRLVLLFAASIFKRAKIFISLHPYASRSIFSDGSSIGKSPSTCQFSLQNCNIHPLEWLGEISKNWWSIRYIGTSQPGCCGKRWPNKTGHSWEAFCSSYHHCFTAYGKLSFVGNMNSVFPEFWSVSLSLPVKRYTLLHFYWRTKLNLKPFAYQFVGKAKIPFFDPTDSTFTDKNFAVPWERRRWWFKSPVCLAFLNYFLPLKSNDELWKDWFFHWHTSDSKVRVISLSR